VEHLKHSWKVERTGKEGRFYEILTIEERPWLIGTLAHSLPKDPFGAKTAEYIVELHNYTLKSLKEIQKCKRIYQLLMKTM